MHSKATWKHVLCLPGFWILCSMGVNNWSRLSVFLGDVAVDGKTVFGKCWAGSKSFSPAFRDFSWLLGPYTLKHKQSIGRGAILCFVSDFNTWGTPKLVMRKLQECWAFPVWYVGPGTSKILLAAVWVQRGKAIFLLVPPPLPLIAFIIHTSQTWGSRMTTVCVSHIQPFPKRLFTRELCGILGLWLNRDEGGVCVGVVGMVMVNSTRRAFRMFP